MNKYFLYNFSRKWTSRICVFPILVVSWIIFREKVLFYVPQLQKKITNSFVYYVDVLSDVGGKACVIFYDSVEESFQVVQVDLEGKVHWKKKLQELVEENGRHSPYFCISRKYKNILYKSASFEISPKKEWTKTRFKKSGEKEYEFFPVEGETFVPADEGVFFVDKYSASSSAISFFSWKKEREEELPWLFQKPGFFYNPYYWKEANMLVYNGIENSESTNKLILSLYLHNPNLGSWQKQIEIFDTESEDPLDVMKFSGNKGGDLFIYGSEGQSVFLFHKNKKIAQEIFFPGLEALVSFDFCVTGGDKIWVLGIPLGSYIPQLHLYNLKKMMTFYHKMIFMVAAMFFCGSIFLLTRKLG